MALALKAEVDLNRTDRFGRLQLRFRVKLSRVECEPEGALFQDDGDPETLLNSSS